MSFKEKINKILRSFSNANQIDDADFSKFIKEHDERILKGATSDKSYSVETFEKIWELVNFSDKEILGIEWNELNRKKIEKKLFDLGLKMRPSKNSALVGFDLEFITGDTVDGTIAVLKNRLNFKEGIDCSFGFVDKKADKLIEWIEKKYGKPLKLRDDTASENHYDWLVGDVLITVDMAKLSGLCDMRFENMPGYAKMVRGKISYDEFSKNYLK